MITNIDKLITFLFILIPLFLITGPAVPDIIISFSAIYFLISFLLIKKEKNFLKDNFFLISIFFWLSLLIVSFFAFNKIKSFQDSFIFLRLLIIPTVGYYLLLNDDKKIKSAIYIIFFCVCFVSIDTLFQFLNYDSKDGFGRDLLGFKSDWYGRLTGPFGDELVPGAYISKFGLLGYIFFYLIKKNKYNFYLEILYLSLLGLICFGSGERMALATYFLGLFFLLVFLKNKRFIISFSIIISILLILISYKFHPFYNDYKVINSTHFHQGLTIEKYFDCDQDSSKKCTKIIKLQPSFLKIIKNFNTSAYGEIYKVGWNMFKDNPYTGIGISNYQTACLNIEKYNKLMAIYDCASHPHNTYVQWLSEGGLISFFAFILFLSMVLYIIFSHNNSKNLKFISLACILIMFWPIMSTGSLIKNWNGILTFYIIGVCICVNRIKLN